MTLGVSERFSIYVWDISASEWVSYKENLLKVKIKEEINTLKGFEAVLCGVYTSGQKDDIVEDNVCIIYSGTTLLGKFRIGQPEYTTDGTVRISGYVSTGSKLYIDDTLINSITRDEIWKNERIEDIFTKQFPTPGILRADDGDVIISLSIASAIADTKITLKMTYEPRINVCDNIANKVNAEWWFSTVDISDSPHSAGVDYFNIYSQKGTASPAQYTFNVSGATQNCMATSNNQEIESLCNRVVVLGYGSGVKQMKVENFHATDNRTHLDGNMDTYLNGALSSSAKIVTVYDTSKFESSGRIRIGDEYIDYTFKDATHFGDAAHDCTRAANSSEAVGHPDNSDVLNYGTDGTDVKVYTDSASSLPASGDVYVGSESISYGAKATNTLTGCARGSDPYTHLDDTEVYDAQYTVTSPESGSSIHSNGLHSKTLTDATSTKRDELDKKAEYYRDAHDDAYERITVTAGDPMDVLDEVVLGDTVTVNDSQTGLSSTYRIFGMDITMDLGSISVILQLSNRKFDYSTELKEGLDVDFQQPARALADMISEFSKWDGENLNQLGMKYLNASLTEGESGYGLRDHDGTMQFKNTSGSWTNIGTGGSGFWTDEGAYLKATEDQIRLYHNTEHLSLVHDGSDAHIVTSLGDFLMKGGGIYVYTVASDNQYTIGISKNFNGDGTIRIGSAEFRDNTDATSYGQAYHDDVDFHITTGKGDLNLNPTGKVKIKGAYSLPSVDGSNGQVITTDGNDTLSWSDATSGTLTGLSDTTITSPAEADILSYDDVNDKWINRTLPAAGFLADTADVIKDTHIDWGTGATQVSLDDVPDGTSYERVAAGQLGSGIYIDATDAVKGIASFDSGDFTVTSGAVTLAGTYIANPLTGDLDVNHFTLVNGYAYEIKHTGHTNPIVNVGRTGTYCGIVTMGSVGYGANTNLNQWAQMCHDGDEFAIQTGEGDIKLAPAGVLSTTKQFQSSVITGAPITVDSVTMCTNLNADMVDGFHANEFVTNPITSANLQIHNAYDLIFYSDGGGIETMRLYGNSGTIGCTYLQTTEVYSKAAVSGQDLKVSVDYTDLVGTSTWYTYLAAHNTNALGIKGVWNGSAITTCDIQVYVPLVMQNNAIHLENIAPFGSEINIDFANTLALKSGATTVAQFKNAYLDMQNHSIVNVQYITCSSTTLCTNLNAQYLNGSPSSSFVSNPMYADLKVYSGKDVLLYSDGGGTLKAAMYGNDGKVKGGLVECTNIHGGSVMGSHTNFLGGNLELTGGGKYYGDGSALTGISGASLWVDISSQYIKPVSAGRSVCPNGAKGNLGVSASPGEWNNIYMKGELRFNVGAMVMKYNSGDAYGEITSTGGVHFKSSVSMESNTLNASTINRSGSELTIIYGDELSLKTDSGTLVAFMNDMSFNIYANRELRFWSGSDRVDHTMDSDGYGIACTNTGHNMSWGFGEDHYMLLNTSKLELEVDLKAKNVVECSTANDFSDVTYYEHTDYDVSWTTFIDIPSGGARLLSCIIVGWAMEKVRITIDGHETIILKGQYALFEDSNEDDTRMFTLPPLYAHTSLKVEWFSILDGERIAGLAWVKSL